ncbi:hypothetical protein [Galactobacter caseinivorans]|uniref:Uncharacterized protein n=1 Tax=Galactobacter caseinivorans TaxID=2676123 RepID=A0A496PGY0_9MICC|nr:hypothetical protein [Galactobacter caseinivorans]RKW69729.1 hypothetical protein DWQ67_11555 [Galactobacter caseinivorans]
MDQWTTIITAGMTTSAALLGVLLTGILTAGSERLRRKADDEREEKRILREDEAAKAREETQAREADAAIGTEIAELFLQGRRYVERFGEDGDTDFDGYFDRKWDNELEEQLRMTAWRVRDDEARSRLVAVMDALLDYQPLAPRSGSDSTGRFVEQSMLLGAELAFAVSREQQPEAVQAQRFDVLRQTLKHWDEYLERQRAQRERDRLAREEEEIHRYKQEDSELDVMVDLATDLQEEGDASEG